MLLPRLLEELILVDTIYKLAKKYQSAASSPR
jgi:hypothetical protein